MFEVTLIALLCIYFVGLHLIQKFFGLKARFVVGGMIDAAVVFVAMYVFHLPAVWAILIVMVWSLRVFADLFTAVELLDRFNERLAELEAKSGTL